MEQELGNLLNEELLSEIAGSRTFARGREYCRSGRVHSLIEREGRLRAVVEGAQLYQVQLWAEDGELAYACDCPVGSDGIFCKHCVAVALAWLDDPEAVEEQTAQHRTAESKLRTYLEGLDRTELVRLLLEQAAQDVDFGERLQLKAAATAERVDVATFRQSLQRALATDGYVEYGEARGYAQRIDMVLDSIAQLLDAGQAEAVIDLAEEALERLEEVLSHGVDDSEGHVGGILMRAQELHHQACHLARPDPEELARYLFDWEMRAEFDTFFDAMDSYAEVLGEAGTALYRRLAEAEWQRLPALKPGDQRSFEGNRYRLTRIMERLTEQLGDIDALIAVKSRDLSSAYAFLQIAELCRTAGRDNEALEWAERGWQAFNERPDGRLRDFLVDEYQRRDRFDAALNLVWTEFNESPYMTTFAKLRKFTEGYGLWPQYRESALAHIRALIGKKQDYSSGRYGAHLTDGSLLVEFFLSEGDVDQALREAKALGCDQRLWLRLAEALELEHPEEALPIYRRPVDALIEQTNNDAYAQAVRLLVKVHLLMDRLGRHEQFEDWLAHLRKTYKAKRNFIKLVNTSF
ncbi:SWIM zinc finger family protein [Gloeobacter violaceus]|nr:DUF6880 family protein [Gloeobacter violaceus]